MTTKLLLRTRVLVLLPSLIFLFLTCIRDQSSITDLTPDKKQWTLMFYCDEDYYFNFQRFELFSEAMCSGDNLNVIVLHDRYEDPATYYYIDENHQPLPDMEKGELNMGNYETLRDFLVYGKENYPAEHYILALHDHGGGWVGACWDFTNDNDWLTPHEIHQALAETGKVDLFMFSVACRMGALEVAYEIRDYAEIYVASENRTSYWFWEKPMERICQTLHDSPEISTSELSKKIVEFIRVNNFNPSPFQDGLTQSAVKLEKLEELKQALDDLAQLYLVNPDTLASHLSAVNIEIMSYNDSDVDIYDFAHELLKVETNPLRRSQLKIVKECLQDAVIANCWSEGLEGSHGLTIYFPDPEVNPYNTYYHYQGFGLDFPQDSHWDELLMSYFNISGGQIKKMPLELWGEMELKDNFSFSPINSH